MNTEQQQLLLIRHVIAELPEKDRVGVSLAATKLREILMQHNDHGLLALALVSAEHAAED